MKPVNRDYNPVPPKKVYEMVKMTPETLEAIKANARREVLEQACKAVCYMCNHNWPLEKHQFQTGYIHYSGGTGKYYGCLANPIRVLLMAADQPGQGQGEEE